MKKYLVPFLIGAGMLFYYTAFAGVNLPFQGGTGTGATPASGTVLIGNGTGTYTAGNLLCSGGCSITNASGSITINQGAVSVPATTTINGVTGPTFTFSIVSTTSVSSITTSSAQLFLNLLKYTSGTNISVAANGVINFINPGFLTNASITATGPITWSGASVIACPTCLTSAPATTTINGTQTSTFYIVGTSGVTTTVSGATTTFSLAINNGVTQTCPAGQAVVSTTAQGIVGCSTFATSTGGSAAGASGDIQLNTNGSIGADTGNFTYVTNTETLKIGSSSYFANYPTLMFSTTTNVTSSWTVPVGVTKIQIFITSAGGGGDSGFAAPGGGGGHAWLGTTSTSPVATSTMVLLCGGGAGTHVTATPGTSGQGLNTAPDTYGGTDPGNGVGSTTPTCFLGNGVSTVATSTPNNAGVGNTNNGLPGIMYIVTTSTVPGTVYWYQLGTGGTGAGGATSGGGSSLMILALNTNPTVNSSTYNIGNAGQFITGGSTPFIATNSCGTNAYISGNNQSGRIFVGSGGVTSCQMNFSIVAPYSSQPFQNTPDCVITPRFGTSTYISAESTTSITLTFNSAVASNAQITYWCPSH